MTVAAVTDAGLAAATSSQSSTQAQPAAQQVARFEQQLHEPASGAGFYQPPAVQAMGTTGNWSAMMKDVGHLSEELRAQFAEVDTTPDMDGLSSSGTQGSDPVQGTAHLEHTMAQISHLSYTTMSMSFVTSAERLAGENVRSLYQMN